MVTQPPHIRGSGLFKNLLRRLRASLSQQSELAYLSRQDIDFIARELNLSTSDFRALAQSPSLPELLSKRLARAGISEESLASSQGDVLRDLQRVCGLCHAKARCAASLKREKPASAVKYCPNEATLRALAREADNTCSTLAINANPSCSGIRSDSHCSIRR